MAKEQLEYAFNKARREQLVNKHNAVHSATLAEIIGYSESHMRRILCALCECGVVERIGTRKGFRLAAA